METIFVTESREMLFTGTEDIDVRPLHSSELHYEGDSREEALRAAHKVSAASRVGVCQRGFARFVATVSEITRDGEGFTEHMDTVHTVDPLDRMPELRTLAREAAANRADGKIIRHIAGHTEAIDTAKRAGDYYSLYRVEGSAFGDFSCYRVRTCALQRDALPSRGVPRLRHCHRRRAFRRTRGRTLRIPVRIPGRDR